MIRLNGYWMSPQDTISVLYAANQNMHEKTSDQFVVNK